MQAVLISIGFIRQNYEEKADRTTSCQESSRCIATVSDVCTNVYLCIFHVFLLTIVVVFLFSLSGSLQARVVDARKGRVCLRMHFAVFCHHSKLITKIQITE